MRPVFASDLILSESRGPVNRPLENVKITVDGAENELFTFTDDMGNFRLDPAPVGTFFVHIDGRDVPTPDDSFYAFVGKPWTSIAGTEVNVGDEFLPLIVEGTLQPVSDVQPVQITFPDDLNRHFPDNLQIHSDHTQISRPLYLFPLQNILPNAGF